MFFVLFFKLKTLFKNNTCEIKLIFNQILIVCILSIQTHTHTHTHTHTYIYIPKIFLSPFIIETLEKYHTHIMPTWISRIDLLKRMMEKKLREIRKSFKWIISSRLSCGCQKNHCVDKINRPFPVHGQTGTINGIEQA
jgi:hypothetical protein